MPTTAKMKTMMASTRVKFPRAPTELPMILISMFKLVKYWNVQSQCEKLTDFDPKNNSNSHRNVIREPLWPDQSSAGAGHVTTSLTSLKERSTDRPSTLARPSSIRLRLTMMPSKMFQPSWK
ncbi:hypothetical protein EYF80_028298 [Liparis tanakae]|uniref:Uncharacterized protein n=1 Tax=Liparis tanakae TaxID=230148 RepID=A0A4Z2H931_9TELE|nr:hypothetical protein EYF80_028298 [Liparis tanakae]